MNQEEEDQIVENISTVKAIPMDISPSKTIMLRGDNSGQSSPNVGYGSPSLGPHSPNFAAEEIELERDEPYSAKTLINEDKPMAKEDAPKEVKKIERAQKKIIKRRTKKWKTFSALQKREEIDRNDPTNQPFLPTEDFIGPLSKNLMKNDKNWFVCLRATGKRKKTNRIWIWIFIVLNVYWGIHAYLGTFSFIPGPKGFEC
jgi:hypothetical protein